ncbi:MAG: AAA family ATPase [Cyanobacteria bacterium J06627_32]
MTITTPAKSLPRVYGYTLLAQLYKKGRIGVYRAMVSPAVEADSNGRPRTVVIKLLETLYPSLSDLAQFRNQYVLTKDLDIPGVVRPLSLQPWQKGYALVMEDFGGISLDHYHSLYEISLGNCLEIALQLSEALHQLAQRHIVHKDIKPANILINPDSLRIELIDFSIASQLAKENQAPQSPSALEGTLAYLAPEQTGRMNRGIDYRTDFYALGVTLYELLTGELPFRADDPLEQVHNHMAIAPQPLQAINPEIPEMVSKIVLKLMAKNAENRYQSSFGLRHDLERCLTQWQETGKVSTFELGARDLSDRFTISERLYGREAVVQTLLNTFDRVAASDTPTDTPADTPTDAPAIAGLTVADPKIANPKTDPKIANPKTDPQNRSELLLVAGTSGIGKTAVINEVHKPITQQQSYFLKGKFDQLNRNLPLSAFLQAIRGLIHQLRLESNDKLVQWRRKILEAVGEDGQILTDVIPELESIIGAQPEASPLTGAAAQNRFTQRFLQLIDVFARPQQPLVIFLDDLQWADSASLQLIAKLMTAQGPLLILGAYRDNEVSPAHPLMLTLEDLASQSTTGNQAAVNTVTLAPLTRRDTNGLVADTLHYDIEYAAPLADLVFRKTKGNPFFTTQFLKSLHEEGHIRFDSQQGSWSCDMDQVALCSFTDDVVEFISQQLQKLPHETQQIIQLAACIGNSFDLETLAIAADQSPSETATALWQGLQEGLIVPQSEKYKFYLGEGNPSPAEQSTVQAAAETVAVREPHLNNIYSGDITYSFFHDRVQQAAYSLIEATQKQSTHLKIGQRLLNHLSEAEQKETLFEIVNHLNAGIALISDPAQQEQLAALNFEAGQKAKTATAYQSAAEYFSVGIQLLKSDCWQSQYALALGLHTLAAEACLICGDLDGMEQRAAVVLQHAKATLDKINIYQFKIQAYTSQTRLQEALSTAYQAFQTLGLTFPEAPGPGDIQQSLQQTSALLDRKEILSLAELPEMTATDQLAIMQLTSTVIPAAFLRLPPLFPLLILLQIRISIEYGNAPQSPFSYAAYGLFLNTMLNDLASAERFGQLALDLAADSVSKALKARTYFVVGSFIKHHTCHLQSARSLLIDSYKVALDGGDLEYVGYAAFHICQDGYLIGQELTLLEKSVNAYSQVLADHRQIVTFNYCRSIQQAILNLIHETDQPHRLLGEAFDEEVVLPQLQTANDATGLYTTYVHKLILSYLFEAYPQAEDYATKSRAYLMGGSGFAITPLFYCYDSLTTLQKLSQLLNEPSYEASNKPDEQGSHTVENTAETGVENSATEATIQTESTLSSSNALKDQSKALLERVAENQKQLKHWADHAPMNYLHKFNLVEAERCRCLGNIHQAIEKYDLAISGAEQQGYSQEIALANELAAKFYLNWRKEHLAVGYMQEAYYGYIRWGASAKVAQLERHYPQLLASALAHSNSINITASSMQSSTVVSSISRATNSQNMRLDFSAIMKAAQAISQEIELESLLTTLMKIVLSIAGAQMGTLLLLQGEQWQIVAKADQHQVNIAESDLEQYSDIPHSLIYAVARSQQAAVYENLAVAEPFESDRYISLYQPKSAMCMPVSRQGELIGILYLENSLIEGAFTRNHLDTLQLLTSQAAISIENARLYQQTENYSQNLEIDVAKKTTELNQKVIALEVALKKLKETQAQLIQTEKMSSLGQLVAGIAHEINNPINFIHANLKHIEGYNQDLLTVIEAYQESIAPPSAVVEVLDNIDLDFLVEDSQSLLSSMRHGSDRIKQMVLSLRNFSRLDESETKRVNVHEGLESTLGILQHRLQETPTRSRIAILRDYGELPLIECRPGPINQVFMNILSNAIDALADSTDAEKTIRIRTTLKQEGIISIQIADNGAGIPEDAQLHIFDPFFTTKPVGKGTGLGLSISYQIITENHRGKLYCESTQGKGTQFTIEVPISLR